MELVSGGRTNYGEVLGIIMLDTVFPRIPGDIGNASTFPFPVRYQYVKGASPQRVIKERDPALLAPFVAAAQELEGAGVRAITTSCGFLALFQRELAAAVNIPVFTSSLLQLPLLKKMLQPQQPVGIITAHGPSLTEDHLAAVGAAGVPYLVAGFPEDSELSRTYVCNSPTLDKDKAEAEVVALARELVVRGEVGALLLECTNLPPFAGAIQRATGLPVFDIVTMAHWLHSAILQAPYRGFL